MRQTKMFLLLLIAGVAVAAVPEDLVFVGDNNLENVRQRETRGQECLRPAPDEYECTENGAFPHPDLCEYYYDCYEGNATLCRCTDDLLFDLVYSGCNYPEQTDCGDRATPKPISTRPPVSTTTPDPNQFVCPELWGIYPNPDDCGSFYNCINGDPRKENCPPGLVFNPRAGYCDFPSNVPECSS